jgi:hypothetical protein
MISSSKLVDALRVPRVGFLASTGSAACSSSKALSAALSVESGAASLFSSLSWRRSRNTNSGHGGRNWGSDGCGSGRLRSNWRGGRDRGDDGRGGGLSLGRGGRCRASTATSSTSPDSWAGHGEGFAAVVDAEVGVGVGGLVRAGELQSVSKRRSNVCEEITYLDHGTWGTAAAASDLDLHARDVVLGLVDVGAVNTNVLSAHQVLSVGSVLGDLRGNEVAVVIAPCGRGEIATVADTFLVDLEPIARSIVFLHTSSWSLRQVHQTGAGMTHFRTHGQLEAYFLTRVDCQHLSLAGRGEGSLVATNVRAIRERSIADISRRIGRELNRVVLGHTSGLADVFKPRLGNTTNDVGVEEVVGGRHLGTSANNEGRGRELHADRAVMNV